MHPLHIQSALIRMRFLVPRQSVFCKEYTVQQSAMPCLLLHQIEREFDELDVDHDGFITPQDLVAASRAGVTSNHTGRTHLSAAAIMTINDTAGSAGESLVMM